MKAGNPRRPTKDTVPVRTSPEIKECQTGFKKSVAGTYAEMGTEETELYLQWTGVKLTAERHIPSILTPEFLSASGIVPTHWRAVESNMSQDESSVEYHNGVLWKMDEETLTIEDERPWEPDAIWDVQSLATRYLNEVRVIPYDDLTIDFRAGFLRQEPGTWITDRFLNPTVAEGVSFELRLIPHLLFEIPEGPVVRLAFSQGSIRPDPDTEEEAVVISVALFHGGPLNWSEMTAALNRLPNDRDWVLALLSDLLEVKL